MERRLVTDGSVSVRMGSFGLGDMIRHWWLGHDRIGLGGSSRSVSTKAVGLRLGRHDQV